MAASSVRVDQTVFPVIYVNTALTCFFLCFDTKRSTYIAAGKKEAYARDGSHPVAKCPHVLCIEVSRDGKYGRTSRGVAPMIFVAAYALLTPLVDR